LQTTVFCYFLNEQKTQGWELGLLFLLVSLFIEIVVNMNLKATVHNNRKNKIALKLDAFLRVYGEGAFGARAFVGTASRYGSSFHQNDASPPCGL
jgi:hypothetical protein